MILTTDAVLLAALLFTLRIINYAVSTMRLVFISRGQRPLAAALALLEALIFAVVMASVVADLSNWLNLGAYCLGAAAGSYIGMMLESRLITSYRTVNVIVQKFGEDIARTLRMAGYAVTESEGRGLQGQVTMLRSVVNAREVPDIIAIIQNVNPEAFIQVEEARTIRSGYMRLPGGPRH